MEHAPAHGPEGRLPAARIGLFSRRREAWMPEALFESAIVDAGQFVPAEVVHVHARDITATIVEQLHDLGRQVHANDAAAADDVRRAIVCGADRLSTDDPQTAVAVRRSMRPTVGSWSRLPRTAASGPDGRPWHRSGL